MLWTCTGIWTWSALVWGWEFVAEMGWAVAFQVNGSEQLDSRADSGDGVHRPRLSGTSCTPGESGQGARPLLEKYILYPRGEQRSAVCGTGRAGGGVGPGQAVAAETGPCWRARVTALPAGWLTLATAAARAAWRMSTGLRLVILVNRMAHQRGSPGRGAAAEAQSPDRGGKGLRHRCRCALAIRSIPVQFLAVSCPMDVNDLSRTAPKPLRGHWPGPDTGFVVWLFQRFHCPETWRRDPCPPGPAP